MSDRRSVAELLQDVENAEEGLRVARMRLGSAESARGAAITALMERLRETARVAQAIEDMRALP